jgi:hypothetical protein
MTDKAILIRAPQKYEPTEKFCPGQKSVLSWEYSNVPPKSIKAVNFFPDSDVNISSRTLLHGLN